MARQTDPKTKLDLMAWIDRKKIVTLVASLSISGFFLSRWPFPAENALLQLIAWERPGIYHAIQWAYLTMAFTTPCLILSAASSLAFIFLVRGQTTVAPARLSVYPEPAERQALFLILGEVHNPKRPESALEPQWLTIPERGLYTGILIFGAIGSGKTTSCMVPYADQVLAYHAHDINRRIGGLVLEVKGDFCHKIHGLLEKHGRVEDYIEISLDADYRYNPLYNDLDAYALAFGIASLLNNLYGKGKEPFWQQAYTNLIKFVILLHQILYDYVTLFDVYQGAINPDYLAEKIKEAEEQFTVEFFLIPVEDFVAHRDLEAYPFECDSVTQKMKVKASPEVRQCLTEHRITFETIFGNRSEETLTAQEFSHKREQVEAVQRWFNHDWLRIEARLRTSIIEGISVFLSLFDDNPAVKRTFCPPKETYDPVANADGRYGKPLPPFSELIERGAVCALNFPVSTNPGLAKAIGTMMKQDFQRAVLNRIPRIDRDPARIYRQVLFLCDEYHAFATVGENDPSGDEKFFALSRQAKCVAIVATQSISSLRSTLPGESWRTLLQTFRTKIFLSLADDFSAKCASDLCGREEQLKLQYNIAENGQDAGISVLTGRAGSQKATLSTSKGYNIQRDLVFEPKVFSELKNAQAIVLAYDGLNPHPPTYCYLKPCYLDTNTSYFEQLAKGDL